ncbi:hypothetical protein MMC25_005268 [Agyrium rufum]|nr:hypothetical protein [Agyrium rufum]
MPAPPMINDPGKTEILKTAFASHFGSNLEEMEPNPGSDDFSVLATVRNITYLYWIYGGAEAEKYEEATRGGKIDEVIPYNQSAPFAPVIQPTLRIAVEAFTVAELTFFD